jgi:hypothetical protein
LDKNKEEMKEMNFVEDQRQNPPWAKHLFSAVLSVAVSTRNFWPELKDLAGFFYENIFHQREIQKYKSTVDIIFSLPEIGMIPVRPRTSTRRSAR